MSKYIIFDVDGTLNQTTLYAVEAYQTALKRRGIAVDNSIILSIIRMSPVSIAKRLIGTLNEEDFQSWQKEIRLLEQELMEKKAAPFVGMSMILDNLRKNGYKLAICSNAYREHIENVLNAIKLRSYFKEIGSLEMGKTKIDILRALARGLI